MKAIQYSGLFALLLLLATALAYLPSRIESGLNDEIQNTLIEHNLDWLSTSIDGQDLTIRGEPPSPAEKERALTVLQGIDGLRVIHDQLSDPAIAPRQDLTRDAAPQSPPSAMATDTTPEPATPAAAPTATANTAASPESGDILVPAKLSARMRCEESLRRAFKGDTIHFQMNTSVVRPASRRLLSRLASAVKRDCQGIDLTIAGYTDSLGPAKVNLALSQARAKVIKDYLVRHGVSGKTLNTVGYGESKPIASNKTRAGRIKNRRIEIHTGG